MKLKEFSVAEIITILTTIGLSISVIAQSYFYFRLNAIWVMSLISPTIYLLDVIKVISILLILVMGVSWIEIAYRKCTKSYRLRKKVVYRQGDHIQDFLNKNRIKYEIAFRMFLVILLGIVIIFIFPTLNFKPNLVFCFILGITLGTVLLLVLEKSISRRFRQFTALFLLITSSILYGEYKFIKLENLPQVTYKENNKINNKFYLLEISKTNAVIVDWSENGTNSFKIVDLNQIDTISESE